MNLCAADCNAEEHACIPIALTEGLLMRQLPDDLLPKILRKARSSAASLAHASSDPAHAAAMLRDLVPLPRTTRDDREHMQAAMDWLIRAQDHEPGGGVSAGYDLSGGWRAQYRETTGYIITTFLDYAAFTGDGSYRERAIRMGDWEIDEQLPEGGVIGLHGAAVSVPIVFNTGQVMIGWNRLYRDTGERRFLDAAERAARWLASIQEDDGSWVKHCHLERTHTYHTRVSWPLLETADLLGDEGLRAAGVAHVRWAMARHEGKGWFGGMEFAEGAEAFTHTIAYTLRGLLEARPYLRDDALAEAITKAVRRAAFRILHGFERRKRQPDQPPLMLPGTLGRNYRSDATFSCLTGNVQLAIVMMKLYRESDDPRLFNAALKLNDHVKSTQDFGSRNPGIRGAIAGSYPLWGAYQRFAWPNWAAKFFVDALLLQEAIMADLEAAEQARVAGEVS